MSTSPSPVTTARSVHASVAVAGLLDGDICRVETDVEFNRLGSLLPFPQITPLSAANVKNQKPVIGGLASFPGARGVIFVWRKFLNDAALDPVVERSQAFDPAVGFPPVATTLWDGVVVGADDVVDVAAGVVVGWERATAAAGGAIGGGSVRCGAGGFLGLELTLAL